MNTIEKLINKVAADQQKVEGKKDSAAVNTESSPVTACAESAGGVAAGPGGENIVQLNYKRLGVAGIFAPDETRSHVRDEFRRIKRPLLSNAIGRTVSLVDRGNLIMVTSSLPDEGKTFTTVNLALSITLERDYTVLLVDADPTKSDVTRLFDLENRPGLTDLLQSESLGIGDVMVKTDIPNLSLIPSGLSHPQMTELLASHRMERIITEMSERYSDRVIIFDAPPLLVTSEAQLLADLVGQIAFVIRAGSTPEYVIEEALATLDQGKAIGLILNQTQRLFGSNYHGGYYGGYE